MPTIYAFVQPGKKSGNNSRVQAKLQKEQQVIYTIVCQLLQARIAVQMVRTSLKPGLQK